MVADGVQFSGIVALITLSFILVTRTGQRQIPAAVRLARKGGVALVKMAN